MPPTELVPDDCGNLIAELRDRVRGAYKQAQRRVDTAFKKPYWSIGQSLAERQKAGRLAPQLASKLLANCPGVTSPSYWTSSRSRACATGTPHEPPSTAGAVTFLTNQIMRRTRERIGAPPTYFAGQLAPADTNLARQLSEDPYLFRLSRTH
jgi:hypothetical protein